MGFIGIFGGLMYPTSFAVFDILLKNSTNVSSQPHFDLIHEMNPSHSLLCWVGADGDLGNLQDLWTVDVASDSNCLFVEFDIYIISVKWCLFVSMMQMRLSLELFFCYFDINDQRGKRCLYISNNTNVLQTGIFLLFHLVRNGVCLFLIVWVCFRLELLIY